MACTLLHFLSFSVLHRFDHIKNNISMNDVQNHKLKFYFWDGNEQLHVFETLCDMRVYCEDLLQLRMIK